MSHRERLYKVITIGNSGVGKTSLLKQFVESRFTKQYRATVGADYMQAQVMVDDKVLQLQIWDTAGQERFQSLGAAFYRGADCCILVFDLTDKESFASLDSWKEEFLAQCAPKDPEHFPFVLIGNKVDRTSERKVGTEEAKTWCKNNNDIPYYETSAKDRTQVEEAFIEIAKKSATQIKEDEMIFRPDTVKKLDANKQNPGQGGATGGCKCM
jgi:Ras-related protein Rab-7A